MEQQVQHARRRPRPAPIFSASAGPTPCRLVSGAKGAEWLPRADSAESWPLYERPRTHRKTLRDCTDDDPRRRRILFRATHRGTYENDILIGGFVRARLASFTDAELDALEAVMDLPDAVLADWLTGRQPIPPEADSPMLRAMREAAENGEGRPA